MDKGDLVPDAVTIPMILETLREKGTRGWLLDGFPRNEEQARRLWDALQEAGMPLDVVLEIRLPRETAKKRILGRRLCANDNNHPNNIHIDAIRPEGNACRICGGALSARTDDQNEAAINKRHEIYYDSVQGTLAACRFFRDLAAAGKTRYLELDGEGDIAAVRDALLKALQ